MFLVIPLVEFLHVLGVDINVHHENPTTFLCHVSVSSVKRSRYRFASFIGTRSSRLEPGTASPSVSLEDTSPPWSADATRPECGHYWRRPRDSEPPGHGAHPGPMCRAAENHSGNPSWPTSQPWWSAQGTKQWRPRHPVAPVRRDTATGGRE